MFKLKRKLILTFSVMAMLLVFTANVNAATSMLSDVVKIGDYVGYPVGYENIDSHGELNANDVSEYEGWRVISIEDDGTVNLISAGVPIRFYHPWGRNYTVTESVNLLTEQFLDIPFATGEYDTTAPWYVDEGFTSEGTLREVFTNEYTATVIKSGDEVPVVRNIKETDIIAITGDEALGENQFLTNEEYDNLFDIGAYYYLATVYPNHAGGLRIVGGNNGQVRYAGDSEIGVRPVVSLKPTAVTYGQDENNVWVITETKIPVPEVNGDDEFTYDGIEKEIILDNLDESTVNVSGIIAATDAGKYIVEITPKIGYAWEDESVEKVVIEWEIEPASLEDVVKTGDYVNLPIDYTNIDSHGNDDPAWEIKAKVDGWRILSIDEDGTIRLVSAGVPMTYYHKKSYDNPTPENLVNGFLDIPFYKEGDESNAYKFIENGFDSTNLKEVFTSPYIATTMSGDEEIPVVRSLMEDDILAITGMDALDKNDSLVDYDLFYNGAFYYIDKTDPRDLDKQKMVRGVHPTNPANSGTITTNGDEAQGIRPVVTLKNTVKLAGKDENGAWNLVVEQAGMNLTKPSAVGTYTYNGEQQTLLLNNFDSNKMTVSGDVATDAGNYTAVIKLADKVNSTWADGTTDDIEIAWTIEKQKLTKPTFVNVGAFTYNGETQIVEATGFDSNKMLVTGNEAVNAGTYTAVISLADKENNTWADGTIEDLEFGWEITKATSEIVISDLNQTTTNITDITYTITPEVTDGTVKVEYKLSTEDDSAYTEEVPTEQGTYTVRVTVTGDSNVDDIEQTATLTITKESSSVRRYKITVEKNEGGIVTPGTTNVRRGSDKTFEITAKKGYIIKDVFVNGESIGAVAEYTFEDVRKTHTLEVKFEKINDEENNEDDNNDSSDDWENPFVDVDEDDWYYEAVKYTNIEELFNGMTDTTFGPNISTTRGMIVTVLYRLSGAEEDAPSTFDDVSETAYYSKPIAWAARIGIVKGIGENKYAPDVNITREQLAAILYRYAQYLEKDVSVGENTNILSYDDFGNISEYAIPALQWSCGSGLMLGRTETTLVPRGTATRAEVATMLMRFMEL